MIDDSHLVVAVDHQVSRVKVAMTEHGGERIKTSAEIGEFRGQFCFSVWRERLLFVGRKIVLLEIVEFPE